MLKHAQGDLDQAHRTLSVRPNAIHRQNTSHTIMCDVYCACIRHQQWCVVVVHALCVPLYIAAECVCVVCVVCVACMRHQQWCVVVMRHVS
jgi:hypothetical protein